MASLFHSTAQLIKGSHSIDLFVNHDMANRFICPFACDGVPKLPIMLPCCPKKIACGECIQKTLQTKLACPFCRTPRQLSDMKPNEFVQDLINELEVKCMYTERGCTDTRPLENMAAHEGNCGFRDASCQFCHVTLFHQDKNTHEEQCKRPCPFCEFEFRNVELKTHKLVCTRRPVSCQFRECCENFPFDEIKAHQEVCTFRRVRCQHCEAQFLFRDFEYHITNLCRFITRSCPNSRCDFRGTLDEIEIHRSECLFEMIDCPWITITGCSIKMYRKDMDDHSKDFVSHVKEGLETKEKRIKELEESVETCCYEIATLYRLRTCDSSNIFSYPVTSADIKKAVMQGSIMTTIHEHPLMLTRGVVGHDCDYFKRGHNAHPDCVQNRGVIQGFEGEFYAFSCHQCHFDVCMASFSTTDFCAPTKQQVNSQAAVAITSTRSLIAAQRSIGMLEQRNTMMQSQFQSMMDMQRQMQATITTMQRTIDQLRSDNSALIRGPNQNSVERDH
jgi:hypothetical protein